MTEETTIVYVKYQDHILYHRANPETLKPQVRECVGWLVYECVKYIVLAWDRDADPPTLHGGDPKASGLVILSSDILEMKIIPSIKRRLKSNSKTSVIFRKIKP